MQRRALLIRCMNFVGAFRETPLQGAYIFKNHPCIQQRRMQRSVNGLGLMITIMSAVMPAWVALPAIANPSLVRLTEAEVEDRLLQLPGWQRVDDRLHCTYQFANFVEAVEFVNRLVAPAEAAAHHPDLTLSYNRLTLSLTTHDAQGLTTQDFDLAQAIAQLGAMQTPAPLTCQH